MDLLDNKTIIKRVSPTTLEALLKLEDKNLIIKSLINKLLPIFPSLDLEEYKKINKEIIKLIDSKPKTQKK
jgi:hypothetical protein